MKTVVVTPSISRQAGGLFVSVRRLHQSLAEACGVDVEVLTLRDEFTEADLAQWHPLPVRISPARGPRQFGYSHPLRQSLLAAAGELLHVHGLWMYPSVAVSAWHRQLHRPYVISPRGMLDSWALNNSRWKKRLAGWVFENAHLRNAACLHALCQSEAESIRAYGLKNPIAVIPNGIDLPEDGGHGGTSNIEWKRGRKTLLYLGRIHPKKGLVNLLRAWVATLNSQPATLNSWCLAIAGWDQGGHEAELKRLATELGIRWAAQPEHRTSNLDQPTSNEASVIFLGPQFGEEKNACYANCDAFVLPSFSEGLPMVILEAWAHSKPVLMTPECNLPEGFAANAAIRIEPAVESIIQGLQELIRSPQAVVRTWGENGRKLVAEKFSWPGIARDMKAVYDWTLGNGPRPACVFTT